MSEHRKKLLTFREDGKLDTATHMIIDNMVSQLLARSEEKYDKIEKLESVIHEIKGMVKSMNSNCEWREQSKLDLIERCEEL